MRRYENKFWIGVGIVAIVLACWSVMTTGTVMAW